MQHSRLGICEVCSVKDAKYCCPECEVKTCSLDCSTIHKKELDCNGIRSRVKFKPIKSFTNMDFLNDYRLLEEVGRSVEKYSNDKRVHKSAVFHLPTPLYRLRAAAANRKVYLMFLPKEFARRKNNTTFLDFKTQELFWRIEWHFPQADDAKYENERVLDTERLGNVVDQYLNSVSNMDKSLKFYHSTGHAGVSILLKAEKVLGERYFELDPLATLRDNFCGKLIIEFPVMYVILNNHRQCYDIISPDEEEKLLESWKDEQQFQNKQQRDQKKCRNFDQIRSNNELLMGNESEKGGDLSACDDERLASKFNKRMKIDNCDSNDTDKNMDSNSDCKNLYGLLHVPNYDDL